ncbi:MAG: hypothetical protein HY775_04380 [Acidobacteria bacterium]|nr:hypothetical protein [Acidobacteriota bacterium]
MGSPRWAALAGLVPAGVLAISATVGAAERPSRPSAVERVTQEGCPSCHGSSDIVTAGPGGDNPGLYIPADALIGSVHADLTCTACHAPLGAIVHPDPWGERIAARESCAGCHSEPAREYSAGAHGPFGGKRAVARLKEPSTMPDARSGSKAVRPSCVTCHGAHAVAPARSRAFAATTAERCSKCHADQGESFFLRSFHGKETRLGRRDVAQCVDCHGAHLVLGAGNPRSPVAPGRLLGTCRQCHRSAPPNFAGIQIHIAGKPFPADPKLRAATLCMVLLLVGTFGFFGTHTALAIRHAWRERRRADLGERG